MSTLEYIQARQAEIAALDAAAPLSPLDAAAALWTALPATERATLAVLRAALLQLLRDGDHEAAPAALDAARAQEIRAGLLSIIPEALNG
jgi:uncharacterized protein HemY